MGKSEINPLMVSETESESDSDCSEDKEEGCRDTFHSSHDENGSRGRPRRRSGSPVMMAPWAPSPYLRRAWTPEPKKRSSSNYKRSQSVPEPSCSDEIPAQSAETKATEKKAAERAAERVVQKWIKWQMFMKYLADELYADAMVNSVDEGCDEEADCKQKKVHFTDDEINSDNSLAWDDSSNFTALPKEKSVRNERDETCVMATAHPSMVQKSREEKQRTDVTEDGLQEKKEEFLHVVRTLGRRPWMLKVLVNQGVKEAKEVDPKILGSPATEDKETTQKKRQQFRLLVRKLHPSPWMLAALMGETNISTEQKIEVAMKKPNEKRIKFRQLVRKLGPAPWMLRVLANNGVPSLSDVDTSVFNPTAAKEGVTEEKRKELRRAIKEIGPKPWMADVVVNQAKVAAKEPVVETKISEAPEEANNMDDKQKIGTQRKNRMKFRQLVKKLGPAPWMFRVLANNGVHRAREVDTSMLNNLPMGNEMTNEKRKELRSAVKEIGPKPWMVDVVINQAKALINPKQQERDRDQGEVDKHRFRDLVIDMGCKPWMFKVLGNNGVPEAKSVKLSEFQFASYEEEECNMQVKRQVFRKTVRTMGPKPWMLKILIEQCKSSDDVVANKIGQPDRNQNDLVDKRREFRQIVRKLKPGAWMMKALSNNGVQQVARYPANVPDDKTNVDEKKVEFRQAIERIGPKPWMSKVVINQANIIAKVEKIKYPSTGHTDAEMSETEVKAECEKLKKNRRVFAEMVRQMGPKQWMLRVLSNQGLAEANGIDITKDVGTSGESQDEIKPKRVEFRQFVRKIGPKPWMIKVVVKQAKMVAEKKITQETTDDEKAAEAVKLDMKQCRREYSFILKQMKLRPWMLKVLANHGVTEAEKVDESIFEDRSPFNPAKEQQDRIQFRQLIKRIGPKPWMVRALQNQAVISTAEKADILNDKTPDDPKTQNEKKRKFREIVQQMGAEPWMFNVLTNQMKEAAKQSKVDQECRITSDTKLSADGDDGAESKADDMKKKRKEAQRTMRQMQMKRPLDAPAACGAAQLQNRGQYAMSSSAAGSADEYGDSEDDMDPEQMSYIYQQMLKHGMLDPELSLMYAKY